LTINPIPPNTPGGEVARGDVDDDKNEEENPKPEKEKENYDDVYLKERLKRGCYKMHNPTQKCRSAKGIRESIYK
jgi:hypothetical protein